jgi:predicted PurR-regulated permease PerM
MLNIGVMFGMLVMVFYILSVGKELLMPFVIAIALSFIIITLARKYQKIKIKKFKIPYFVALIMAVVTCFLFIYGIFEIINNNIQEVIKIVPSYEDKVVELVRRGMILVGLEELPDLKNLTREINFSSIFTNLASTISSLASYTGMIIIYVLFMLLEFHSFDKKISKLFKNDEKRETMRELLHKINMDIKTYINIKTLTSLMTAVISFIIMKIAGVHFAEFWALLIFLLNFVPTIGSIIAVIPPSLLCLIQFDNSFTTSIVVIVFLVSTQFAIGNLIEPRYMGKSLNLSPLVILLSLGLWGKIWGIVGMFLCVPITVIISIILAKFPKTRPIAVLLSSDGKVD